MTNSSDLLLEMMKEQSRKIEKLESKVDELIALKNKIIAIGVFLSVLFGYIWDWFKDFFSKG